MHFTLLLKWHVLVGIKKTLSGLSYVYLLSVNIVQGIHAKKDKCCTLLKLWKADVAELIGWWTESPIKAPYG